jgi:putative oxidoreductase
MDFHVLEFVLGRVLLGGVCLWAGIEHFLHFQPPLAIIRARGVPYPAAVLVIGSIWEIVLGALVTAGLWLAPASLGLVVFMIAATIIMHNFWDFRGAERVQHLHVALGNAMIVGGLLVLAATAS